MAKCFDVVGYIEPCNAIRPKYTGRALIITGITSEGYFAEIEFNDNGLKVISISGEQDFTTLVSSKPVGGIALPIVIDAQNPFGVTVQSNTDRGRLMYTKTIPVSIPATRDGREEEFIIGIQKGMLYPSVIVLENLESEKEVGAPSEPCRNDIFGAYGSIYIDPASIARNEYENGGAWTFNLVCEEPVPNVICTMNGLSKAINTLNA